MIDQKRKRPGTAGAVINFIKKQRTLLLTLSAAVIFITTYVLILPAVTLDQEEAATQGGIDLPAQEQRLDETVPAADEDTAENAAGTLVCDSEDYEVRASFDEKAGLPENTELRTVEVSPDDQDYQNWWDEALKALQKSDGEDEVKGLSFASFYDISLLSDGNEVEPNAPVEVSISYDNAIHVDDAKNIRIVHLFADEKDNIQSEVLPASDIENKLRKGKLEKTSFTAESFSMYGVVCTMDSQNEADGETDEPGDAEAADATNEFVADGEDYKITVSYDDDAEIPDGTQLIAEEIEQGSDEYLIHASETWKEINKEYFEVEEQRRNYDESMGFLPDVNLKNLDSARFFDIQLVSDGKEIEPEAAGHVEIDFIDGMKIENDSDMSIAYFSGNDLEIIDEVETKTEDSEVLSYRYDQERFSVVGTFVSHETHDKGMTAAKTMTNSFSDSAVKAAGNDSEELAKPQANKTLVPNKTANGTEDGTYTLTLNVSGTSKKSSYSEVNKSNIVIVMDRSSSMENNNTYDKYTGDYDRDLSYYGVLNGTISDNNNVELTYRDNDYYYYRSSEWPRPWVRYTGDVYTRRTRLEAEQDALAALITQLTDKNKPGQTVTDEDGNTISLDDIIEIKLISFASGRTDVDKANNFMRNGYTVDTKGTTFSDTESEWGTAYSDGSTLKNAVTDSSVAKGTNWQEAMQYAKEVADAKKAEQPDEPVYVVFLTDGEPTDIEGDNGNAQWYQDNERCLRAAEPDAKAIVDSHTVVTSDNTQVATDHKFYGIFTYGETDAMKNYLRRLVNYAYGKGDVGTATISGGAADYYFDADSTDALLNAFQHIMSQISESVAYGKVSITDGLTTDAMTTTLVHGRAEGYKYSVTGALGELYSVTATGDLENPTVTFTINDHEYMGVKKTATIDNRNYEYWSCTVGEGDAAAEYRMTLADVSTDGTLKWDLTGIGTLMDGYTYNASFVVWPDQDAYDYVAGLNNGLDGYIWNKSASTYEDMTSTKGYEKGGVERFPSIVKYPNGIYAVLTNTDQKVQYSIVETKIESGETTVTYDGPYEFDLPTPEPMPLTATKSQMEKIWNVERNPAILAQLLYGEGENEHYSVKFDILCDDDPETTEDDAANKYTDITLGWDPAAEGGQGAYVWDPASVIENVEYNGNHYSVGTRWVKEFSIATGLALSTERMAALGLDTNSYRSAEYDGKTYYILEDGHDYSIKELNPRYEFDFESPIYHPMIVDGVLMSVNVTKDEDGKINGITKMDPISVDEEGTSSLKVENNLRGYLHLNKVVVDQDGKTPLPDDETKFEFVITLTDSKGRFSGADIPWYGINGLFYHDEDFNYYQADPTTSGHLRLETEYDLDGDGENDVYDATCSGNFDPDIIGPTTVTYTDKLGKEVTIQLYGNQTTASDDHMTATATMEITQAEVLNIANIPEGSTYRIEETGKAGYEFVKIDWEIRNGDKEETPDSTLTPTKEGTVITGTIISNRDNHVTYTNKCLVTDISLQKLDGSDKGLAGAVFRIVSVDGIEETPITSLEDVSVSVDGTAIGTVTKNIGGETKSFVSAFETTGSRQTLSGLPDGTYRLYEDFVPDGYITKVRYIQFVIENHVMKDVTTDTEDTSMLDFTAASGNTLALLRIANTPGTALPNSGGPGTTWIYLIGTVLLLGCGILLAARRRTWTDR